MNEEIPLTQPILDQLQLNDREMWAAIAQLQERILRLEQQQGNSDRTDDRPTR